MGTAQAEDQFSKDADLFVSGVKDSAGLMFSSPEDMDADETERSVLQRVVKSAEFQYFILVCVLLGAVLAGLQALPFLIPFFQISNFECCFSDKQKPSPQHCAQRN